MSLLWIVTAAAFGAALVAVWQVRRTAKRLEQLSQMYWELKYQHGELLGVVRRLTGEAPPSAAAPVPGERVPEGFIPLASLKR